MGLPVAGGERGAAPPGPASRPTGPPPARQATDEEILANVLRWRPPPGNIFRARELLGGQYEYLQENLPVRGVLPWLQNHAAWFTSGMDVRGVWWQKRQGVLPPRPAAAAAGTGVSAVPAAAPGGWWWDATSGKWCWWWNAPENWAAPDGWLCNAPSQICPRLEEPPSPYPSLVKVGVM